MKRKILSFIVIFCMVITLTLAGSISDSAYAVASQYYLITKSSPSDSSTATSYYYVYFGTSSSSLTPFTTGADSASNTAFSTLNLATSQIAAVAGSTKMLHFAATGNSVATASGTLNISSSDSISTFTSGNYVIYGALKYNSSSSATFTI